MIDSVTLSKPTLEDVFIARTDTDSGRTVSDFLLAMTTLWRREMVRFLRQRSRIVGALGTPLLFWLLLGSGVGSSFRLDSSSTTMGYMEYFFPGTVVLILLFTSIFSTISIIEDRKEGFFKAYSLRLFPDRPSFSASCWAARHWP